MWPASRGSIGRRSTDFSVVTTSTSESTNLHSLALVATIPIPPPTKPRRAFSRALYTGWFRGIDNQALAHARFGTKRGVFLGEVAQVRGESVSLRLQAPLKPG